MSKKDLANVNANLEELANTLPSQNVSKEPVVIGTTVAQIETKKKPAAKVEPTTEPVIQFSLSLRKSLRKELAILASEEDMTMRAFVLEALKGRGLSVTEDDLADKRRK